MFSRFRQHPEDRAIVERLRAEARQSRPAFSEDLHQRLRAAVLPATVRGRPPVFYRRSLAWAMASLAVVVCVALGSYRVIQLHRSARQKAQTAAAIAALANLPISADLGVREADQLASEMLTWEPWAGLDHDARLAATALVQCFPLQPTQP